MNGKVLRNGVRGCSRFFKREGLKNLQSMIGKGLRSHLHFELTAVRNPLSFLLISPVLPPDSYFHLANPQPIVLHRNNKKIHLINSNITATQTSTALPGRDFHLAPVFQAEPDG